MLHVYYKKLAKMLSLSYVICTSGCTWLIGEPFEVGTFAEDPIRSDESFASDAERSAPEHSEPVECNIDADCNRIHIEACETMACISNICIKEFKPFTFTKNEIVGDCLQIGCTGANSLETDIWDDEDIIDDGNPCTINYCLAGKPRIELTDKKCRYF